MPSNSIRYICRSPERFGRCITTSFLLVGALFIGLAQAAIQPLWEGFDDAAHFSYIQQIVEKRSLPKYGDRLSGEIAEYLKFSPGPETLAARWTYKEFFAASIDDIEKVRSLVHAARDEAPRWRNGFVANWEAQQPPIYYLLMAPFYAVSKTWSPGDQMYLLRCASYSLAWLGLSLAAIFWPNDREASLPSPAPALWPLFFPMWFPEMARLGNDCVVVLLVAFAWIALTSGKNFAVLGCICGLGLLTKATFLPFVAAIAALLLYRRQVRELLIFIVVITAISGWWYAKQFFETGNVIGSIDQIMLSKMGGLLVNLRKNGSSELFASGFLYLFVTFLWGAISIPPLFFYAAVLLPLILLGWGYGRYVRRSVIRPTDWIPPLTFVGLLFGLINQMVVYIALWASLAIPGYYLHSFMPVFSRSVEQGLFGIKSSRTLERLMRVAVFAPLVFLPIAMFVQAQYFSGCSLQSSIVVYHNIFSGPCAGDLRTIFEHLSVLAFPFRAVVCFALGWTMLLIGSLMFKCSFLDEKGSEGQWTDIATRPSITALHEHL